MNQNNIKISQKHRTFSLCVNIPHLVEHPPVLIAPRIHQADNRDKRLASAVTQCKTKDVAAAAAEGAPLMGIQTNDPRITLVAGGYPLFADGRIVGAIGVGGGTEAQDCEIAEHVVKVFEELTK